MGAPSDLAPWASDIRVRNGKLVVALRRGLDLNGVLNLIKTQDVSTIRSLRIPGSVGLSGLRALLASNRFSSLTAISMNGFADEDDAIDLVLETESMKRLRVLKVWGVSDAIDMRLARGDFVDSLRQLEIRASPELSSLDRYFASKRVASLRFLVVNGTGLVDASTLFENTACSSLEAISLANCEYGADTIEALAGFKHLNKLRKLNLSYAHEDDVVEAIRDLLRSRALTRLESLTLCGCQLEGFDWSHVSFPALRCLDIRDNALDIDEMSDIIHTSGLSALQEIIVNSPEGPLPPRLDRRIVVDDRRTRFG